jgi:hypothetical protein
MPTMNDLIQAGKDAVDRRRRGQPSLPATARVRPPSDTDELVPSLRAAYRTAALGDDPVQQELFIAAGLRAAGVDAALVVGREIAPPSRAARYLSWVETPAGGVVTTGAPVHELYEEILRIPHDQPR